jgi:hypothetical protein
VLPNQNFDNNTDITLQKEEIIFSCTSLNTHCIELYFISVFNGSERGSSEHMAKYKEKLARSHLLTGNMAAEQRNGGTLYIRLAGVPDVANISALYIRLNINGEKTR